MTSRKHRWAALALLALHTSTLAALPEAGAQEAPPPGYTRAVGLLEAGDSLAAMVTLRTLVEEHPRYGPGWLRLGALLAAKTGYDQSFSSRRIDAETALEQAVRFLSDDPEPHLELGLLFRKQHRLSDAQRVLEKAWELATHRASELPAEQAARLHFTLARVYEAWWEDWQDLVHIPASGEQVHCAELEGPATHEVASVVCAQQWAHQYAGVVPLADLKSEEWTRMLGHYDRAVELDPTHVEAAVGLLGHLADAGRWEEYELRARDLLLAAPEDPRAHLYLGLGLHERGRGDEAGRHFFQALSLMDAEERLPFEDIKPLIPRRVRDRYDALSERGQEATNELLFTGKDPLYLTDSQERRLEHYARIAWADLKFSAPEAELRGWETRRGNLWIRYGPPWRSYQCCFGTAADRFHYWSYGPRGPLFVFQRRRTFRLSYMNEISAAQAEDLENLAPELYRPRSITELHTMPHQPVRFLGDEPGLTLLELYAAPPLDSLLAVEGAPVQAGVFVKTDDLLTVWEHRDTLFVSEDGLALTYRVQLPEGRYQYGMEARLDGPENMARPLARARRDVSTKTFSTDRLSLSDILLAHFVEARTEAPTERGHLSMNPIRGSELASGEPLALYFELYGLRTDDEDFAGYRAELTVEDAQSQGVLTRLVQGAVGLLGGEDEGTRLSWERTVEVSSDRAMDYLTVELPDLEPGSYQVRVRVTDSESGQTAVSGRSFQVR